MQLQLDILDEWWVWLVVSSMHIMCAYFMNIFDHTYVHILCVTQLLTQRLLLLPLSSLSTSSTLQESTTAIVLKGGGLRGASKFLVRKVDEYAALHKGGEGHKGSGHGGGHGGDHGGGGHRK